MERSKSLNSVIPSIKYGEGNGFLLVAGPCVVEGRGMLEECAGFLAELGAVVLNADEIGHEALQPECDICNQVADVFAGRY